MTTPNFLHGSFWVGMFDRAVKTFCQTLLIVWGGDEAFNLYEIDWDSALGLGAGAVLLSILTSFVSAPVGDKGSTSFLPGGR